MATSKKKGPCRQKSPVKRASCNAKRLVKAVTSKPKPPKGRTA